MAGLKPLVDPPGFTPSPYGLLSVAKQPANADPHWHNGVAYVSLCLSGGGGTTYSEDLTVTGTGGTGAPPAPVAKVDNVDTVVRGATPFTVFTEFDCNPVGSQTMEENAAVEALARIEGFLVERAVWTGTAGAQATVWPHLAANATFIDAFSVTLQTGAVTGGVVTGTGQGIAESLGILEQTLSECYNGVGVIHVPRIAAPALKQSHLIKDENNDGVLRTVNGNIVVLGSGYTGSSPSGSARPAGTTWMYATGPVFMYQSPVRVLDGFDKAENTRLKIAERTYVIGWECCHAAVLTKLGQ